MNQPLLIEIDDAVAIISINDAPFNRMTLEFIDQLEALVDKIAADDSIRAVVLTAQGLDNFSVGMNLKQLPEGIARAGSVDALLDQRLRVISAIETMHKPWVVTLFGYCLGGGLEVPLGCHFRLAATEEHKLASPKWTWAAFPPGVAVPGSATASAVTALSIWFCEVKRFPVQKPCALA